MERIGGGQLAVTWHYDAHEAGRFLKLVQAAASVHTMDWDSFDALFGDVIEALRTLVGPERLSRDAIGCLGAATPMFITCSAERVRVTLAETSAIMITACFGTPGTQDNIRTALRACGVESEAPSATAASA